MRHKEGEPRGKRINLFAKLEQGWEIDEFSSGSTRSDGRRH